MPRLPFAITLLLSLLCPLAHSADFDLGLGYAQSRDFWQTVHEVQNQSGNIIEIQDVLKNRYGKPDFGYSYFDAAYSYPHGYFSWGAFDEFVVGTRAEALAGGEVSNPVSPEIQAYADTIGITSFGFRSRPEALIRGDSFWDLRLMAGLGREKRLFAEGAEFLDAIPVRNGTLFLGGASLSFLNQSEFGDDFQITTNASLRAVYFSSSTPPPASRAQEKYKFVTTRWRIQNEWLKQTDTFLSSRTRFGLISVLGQNPVPFLQLPVSWDYQQRLQFFPGLQSISGLGGIFRLLSDRALPNLAIYAGLFGGGIGGGLDLQLGPVLINGSTYSVENLLTSARDHTRIWQASFGVSL